MNRALAIEDALSPLVEAAKTAILTFDARMDSYNRRWSGRDYTEERAREYADVLNQGRPTAADIKLALRGRNLGTITHDEARNVVIQMFLRDSTEDTESDYENLAPQQQLARTVANWVMAAFDEACWMTEDEAESLIARARPHTVAG